MALLIFTVAFGILFAIFATQNTGFVSLRFGNYLLTGMPLYMIVLASLLLGLMIAGIFSMLGWASNSLKLAGKDHRIKSDMRELETLKKDNERLRAENDVLYEKEVGIKTGYEPESRRGFFDRFRHGFSY